MQSERRWQLGDKVKKKRGSSWRGTVCGFYSTPHTPEGYCVDSAFEPGSVQVWPEAALEDWDGVMLEDELRAEITRLTEALRAAEEREKGLREAGLALLRLIGPDNSRVYASDPQVIAFAAALKGPSHDA